MRTALALLRFAPLAVPCIALAQSDRAPSWSDEFFAPTELERAAAALAVPDAEQDRVFIAHETPYPGLDSGYIYEFDGRDLHPLGLGLDGPNFPDDVYFPPSVHALEWLDIGDGPALYVGGFFHFAGGLPTKSLARWNGQEWTAYGDAVFGTVRALAAHDDGSGFGRALYVGGQLFRQNQPQFPNIIRWNGAQWSGVGSGLPSIVRALAVHDDGSGNGERLFAAGDFSVVNGQVVRRVAQWDGAAWSAVGDGLSGTVNTLLVHDLGDGPVLLAGGGFVPSQGIAGPVAFWDGAAWTSIGDGLQGTVSRLLVAGKADNRFLLAYGSNIVSGESLASLARWDGERWIRHHTEAPVAAVAPSVAPTFDADLYYVSDERIRSDSNAQYLQVDNDSAPRFVGAGFPAGAVNGLVSTEIDGVPALVAAGAMDVLGVVDGLAWWDGVRWRQFPGFPGGTVSAITLFDDPAEPGGPSLYVAGDLDLPGAGCCAEEYRVARWDGQDWTLLPGTFIASGPTFSARMFVFDDGAGPRLHVAGNFSHAGGQPAEGFVRWNGVAWDVPPGLTSPNEARTLHVPGLGRRFVAVGRCLEWSDVIPLPFYHAVASWNDGAWEGLGLDIGYYLDAATVVNSFHIGGSPRLIVGGFFEQFRLDGSSVPSTPANGLVAFDGAEWAPFPVEIDRLPTTSGSTIGPRINAMEVFDDGSGPALYVAGAFRSAGNGAVALDNIAKWDGSQWHAVGGGLGPPTPIASPGSSVSPRVRTLAVHDDLTGPGPSLFVGGDFTQAGPHESLRIARWNGCHPSCPADTNNDLEVSMIDLMTVVDALNSYPGNPRFNPAADFNRDNDVDFADLNLLLSNYNTTCE